MEESEDVLRLDCLLQISRGNINEEELFKVLNHLKPTWNATYLITKTLAGGYSNVTLHCFMKSNPDDSVVFRIWDLKSPTALKNILNRRLEVALIHKLGEKGVAPKLYASFTNGVCYEFFDGEQLTTALCRTDEIAKKIAKNFAQVHGIKAECASSESESFKIPNWTFESFPIQHRDPEKDKILQKTIPSMEGITKELKFLEEYLKDINSPLVQCHGDPHAQNMMYNEKTGKLIFIDYEGGHTGYQPSDLARFFLLLSVDYEDFTKIFQQELPNEEYQKKFLKWYLEEWFEISGRNSKDVTENDVNRLYIQVDKYMLFSYFYYAMVFMKMGSFKKKDDLHEEFQTVDWLSVGMRIFETYFAKKEYYISLKVPE